MDLSPNTQRSMILAPGTADCTTLASTPNRMPPSNEYKKTTLPKTENWKREERVRLVISPHVRYFSYTSGVLALSSSSWMSSSCCMIDLSQRYQMNTDSA